jgi:hypothetical protein
MNKEQVDPIAEAKKRPTFKIWSMFYRIKHKILEKIYNTLVEDEELYYEEMKKAIKK